MCFGHEFVIGIAGFFHAAYLVVFRCFGRCAIVNLELAEVECHARDGGICKSVFAVSAVHGRHMLDHEAQVLVAAFEVDDG